MVETSSTTKQLLVCKINNQGERATSPSFFFKGIQMDTWSVLLDIAEIIGVCVLPVFFWMITVMIGHGKKLIVLEERVNDSVNRRITSLESKVVDLEVKIEKKIDQVEKKVDQVEKSVTDCKLYLNDRISETLHTLITKMDENK